MSPDFKHFHWAIPDKNQPLYGLYDLFDNHLFLLSYDFEIIWALKNIIKSKIVLDIVDFSNQVTYIQDKIDNSVVEKYGLELPPHQLFRDLRSLSDEFQNKELYKHQYVINDCNLVQNNVVMDNFKIDLQKQLFFFYRCLHQTNEHDSEELIEFMHKHLLCVAELSESYEDANDRLLNFVDVTNTKDAGFLLCFLNGENLLYE